MVPVLRTLCFAARPTFVVGVCCTAERTLRAVCAVVVCVSCCDAPLLRCATLRVVVAVVCVGTVRETRTLDAVVADRGDVAPNAADAHARIANAKDTRFKMKPLLLFLVFYHKIVVSASVSD